MTEEAERLCRLLRKAELESATGLKFGRGKLNQGMSTIAVIGMRQCEFASQSAGGRPPSKVYVGLASAFPREVFDKYKTAVGAGLQPVTSLGTEAVYSEFGVTANLVALGAEEVIGISLSFVQKNPRQVAETLAKRALARA